MEWENRHKVAVAEGRHVHPDTAKITVAEWCDTWLDSYSGNRERTVRQAKVHIALINKEFGRKPIRSIKPIHVQTWTAKLKAQGYEDSTVYAVYRRLSQVLASAVHNDVLDKNPCSRQVAPRAGRQKPYVATRAQVDAIYAAFPNTCARRSYWGPSPGCGRLRWSGCASPTSTGCASTSTLPSSSTGTRTGARR